MFSLHCPSPCFRGLPSCCISLPSGAHVPIGRSLFFIHNYIHVAHVLSMSTSITLLACSLEVWHNNYWLPCTLPLTSPAPTSQCLIIWLHWKISSLSWIILSTFWGLWEVTEHIVVLGHVLLHFKDQMPVFKTCLPTGDPPHCRGYTVCIN